MDRVARNFYGDVLTGLNELGFWHLAVDLLAVYGKDTLEPAPDEDRLFHHTAKAVLA